MSFNFGIGRLLGLGSIALKSDIQSVQTTVEKLGEKIMSNFIELNETIQAEAAQYRATVEANAAASAAQLEAVQAQLVELNARLADAIAANDTVAQEAIAELQAAQALELQAAIEAVKGIVPDAVAEAPEEEVTEG